MTASFACKVCGVIKPRLDFPRLAPGDRPHACSRCVLAGQQRRLDDIQRQIEAQPGWIAQAVVRAAHDAATPRTSAPPSGSRTHTLRRRVSNRLFWLAMRIHPNFLRAARR